MGGNCEILRTIFQPRELSFDIPAGRRGVYLIILNNFSRRTHVVRSCIFCGFFSCVSQCGIVKRLFIYPSLASAKSFFWFSLSNYKFSLNVCFFLCVSFRRNKISDGYQAGRRISSDFVSRVKSYPMRFRRNYPVGDKYLYTHTYVHIYIATVRSCMSF